MRQLADFVRRMVEPLPAKGGGAAHRGRTIGVIGIPGDRRDADQHDYGYLAAGAFDEIYVREDRNLRGRKPGESAANVIRGVQAARAKGVALTTKVERILDETAAVRMALRRASPGDLVVCCVDDAVGVYKLANEVLGTPGGATAISDPGELDAPAG
jgi:cyanophycin synthetase